MKHIKKQVLALAVAVGGTVWLCGCVSIPPLIQVEHKSSPPAVQPAPTPSDLQKRLEAIERRLDRIEDKLDKKTP